MFKTVKTAVMAVCLVVVFILGLVIYGSIHTSQPKLPSTQLSGLRLDTFAYSLDQLRNASPDNPESTALSPSEASFLVEKIQPEFTWGRFSYQDSYLESSGDVIRILAVFKGPFGLYYRVDYRGTLHYGSGRWTVRVVELKLGKIPVGWFVSSPRIYAGDGVLTEGIEFQEATLDGKGLRADFTNFTVDTSELLMD